MIDAALAGFLQQGLGIHIGTRDDGLQPNGARVLAVAVETGGTHLVAYVPHVASTRILADLESNGQAALSFARPTDDRACQVKGRFESARQARDDERPLIAAQWNGFLGQLERIGIPREGPSGWTTWPAVAIRIEATAVFDQTPGPSAGHSLT